MARPPLTPRTGRQATTTGTTLASNSGTNSNDQLNNTYDSSDLSSSILTTTYNTANQSAVVSNNFFTQSSAQSSIQTGTSLSSLSQRGTNVGGDYAFSSIVYQAQKDSSSALQEFDTQSNTGVGASSATGLSSQASLSLVSVSSGMGSSSITGWISVSSLTEGNQSSAGSSLQTGLTTVSYQDYLHDSYALYEEGQSAGGVTSLSSVVVSDASTETASSLSQTSTTQTGANSSSAAGTSGAYASYSSTGSTQYADGSQTSLNTASRFAVTTSTLYEVGGCATNRVYSYSTFISTTDQQTVQTTLQSSTQTLAYLKILPIHRDTNIIALAGQAGLMNRPGSPRSFASFTPRAGSGGLPVKE